jgi:succinate dehydrogenase/fumarate reductase flavoprotein subunit
MPDPVDRIHTEVLVIGGGAAGLTAALAARKLGARVLLVCKGSSGRSGNTPMAEGAIQACFRPDDSPGQHARDTLASGRRLSRGSLVSAMAERAPGCIRELEALGVEFRKEADGAFFQYVSAGITAPRSLWILGGGPGLSLPLLRAARERGVTLMDDLMATRLLTGAAGAGGACGINLRTGAFTVLEAAAVVLATGGNEELYSLSDAALDATGDGAALAWHAGAELVDMEFIQFFPHSLVHPASLRGVIVPEEVYFPEFGGGRLTDGAGARFAHRYDPERAEFTTRDVLARAILAEVAGGRGGAHGGVFIDLRECRRERLVEMIPALHRYLLANGVDVFAQPLEVAPSAHYQCGGIRIDESAATRIPGLFAAGECTGGIDGANRLASNALAEAVSFGAIAGEGAARHAAGSTGPYPDPDPAQAGLELARIAEVLERGVQAGLDVLEVKRGLQALMSDRVGLARSAAGLGEALAALETLRNARLGRIALRHRDRRCNLELMEYLELCNLLDNAQMVAEAALARRESRGCHFRNDFPEEDDAAWGRSLVVTRRDGRVAITEADLPANADVVSGPCLDRTHASSDGGLERAARAEGPPFKTEGLP